MSVCVGGGYFGEILRGKVAGYGDGVEIREKAFPEFQPRTLPHDPHPTSCRLDVRFSGRMMKLAKRVAGGGGAGGAGGEVRKSSYVAPATAQ